jgi:hypothetical protein
VASHRPAARREAGWHGGLARPAGDRIGGQDEAKVAAGADGELGEDLAQVALDRALRNSRAPISGLDRPSRASPRDLGLLGGQLADGLDGPRTGGLAGDRQPVLVADRRRRSNRGDPLFRRRDPPRASAARDRNVSLRPVLLVTAAAVLVLRARTT